MNAVKTLKREFVKNSKSFVTFIKPTGVTTGKLKATAKKEFEILCSIKGIFVMKENTIDRNVGEVRGFDFKFYCLQENWNSSIDQTCRVVKGKFENMVDINTDKHLLIDKIEIKKLLQFDYGIYSLELSKVKKGNTVWA